MKVRTIFSERVKELSKKQNVSQILLCQEIHVDQSTISKLENGKRDPSLDIVVNIADALNTSTDYLLGRTDDEGPLVALNEKERQSFVNSRTAYFYTKMSPIERELLEGILICLARFKKKYDYQLTRRGTRH